MENQNYIVLEKERDFGDIFSTTFKFVRQNFKTLAVSLLIYVLPFAILTGIVFSLYQNSALSIVGRPDSGIAVNMLIYLGLMMPALWLSYAMISGVVTVFFKLYQSRGAASFTVADVGAGLRKNIGKILLTMLVYMFLSGVGMLFCLVPGIYLGVCLSPLLMIYLLEEKSFNDSFSYAFQLVKENWWNTFLILLVISIVVGALSYIFYIPAYISMFASIITGAQTGQMAPGNLFAILSGGAMVFATLLQCLLWIAIGFQYFNLKEKKEHTGLMNDLEKIG